MNNELFILFLAEQKIMFRLSEILIQNPEMNDFEELKEQMKKRDSGG